jgi:uncharacterized protein YqgC (DUF456 family)
MMYSELPLECKISYTLATATCNEYPYFNICKQNRYLAFSGTGMITFLLVLLLIAVLLASWVLTLLGMPGNWLMVAATATYAYLTPAESAASIGWKVVAVLFVLAALGEIIELLAGAMGAAKAGGSKRGAVLALLGSIIGGIVGVIIGMPIPLAGPILAALLFAACGAMTGAIFGEIWAGRNLDASWQIGKAAFLGRLAGTLGKMLIGAVMVTIVVAALVL